MLSGNAKVNKKEIENKIRDYFTKRNDISAVYIFGSFNTERFSQNSDLDLAVIYSEGLDKFKRFDLKLELMAALEKLIEIEVDIVDFENVDLKFKHQILDGKLIYCSDQSRRVELEKRAILNYIDMRKFYKIYDQHLGKRF
ncbi:DNA polymerase, beta-like region [Halanaerobium saccharolyticum subsp. saccharolyticum DSM 6643]|uniref:DNA polymerase, beta-like region n=1 Tax=Halanaerobium saccharolyticum subsp. saccharolyticum DSM 6643 TaxID=1293054 RepID=M5E3T4_9FIRM|nr:nucleotidyltransferase domain-containing protein [Halanaerobium saccharolyticum]CCU80975.1 DNA polymerase, beta-like region [Halanaerobium saccharolyticum subsp. saccharolyticum DSM 6643]